MGYTYYNPLKVWLDPASIADVVSYMQKYLSENPIKDTEEINQIIADYIAAHPEIIGGVQSVNGETGAVVLTASDINTTGTTTIQAVLTSLSSQISEITQTVSQNTDDITDLKSAIDDIYGNIYNGERLIDLSWEHGWVNSSGVYNPNDNRFLTEGLQTENIISVVNSSPNAIYIVYFSDYTDLSNFTYDSFVLVNINKTQQIDRTKPFFLLESNSTTLDGTAGVIVNAELQIKYLSYSNIGGIDFKSISEKTDAIQNNINILDGLSVTENKLYERTTANIVNNNYANIYPSIDVISGTTYYFKNLYAYFCTVKYSDNTSYNLSSDQSTTVNGSFTATKNGKIYISVRRGKSDFVFTESKALYDSGLVNSFYTIDVQNVPHIYHVEKDGSGDFNSLVEAIEEATKYMDSIVYVGAGTWDIIEELGSEYVESVSETKCGVYLKNRIDLIFNPKAVVECIYTGSRADTIAWLSAFNAGQYGFTLEGANIKTGNIRYCVHDERNQDSDFYTNIYKNCVMYHDSSYSQGGQNQCIGGGLGLNGHIIVEGCIFENPNINNSSVLSWHNSAGADAKSFIDVHGCYIRGTNTMRFRYYGTTPATQKTTIICHDNSLGANIGFGPETEGSTNENMELLTWNNEIRT